MNVIYIILGVCMCVGQILGIIYLLGLFKSYPTRLKITIAIMEILVLIACIEFAISN